MLAGAAIGISSVLGGTTSRLTTGSRQRAGATSASRCGVRVKGVRILRGDRVVYREPVPRTFGHEIQCRGRTTWVIFFNGVAASQEGYFGVRSGSSGRTWRPIFTERFFGMKAPHQLDNYLGPWTLRGPDAAYFTGLCPACGAGKVSLWVTTDGGRTFRRYSVPALTGYGPRAVRVSGNLVTIAARRGAAASGPRHKSVTVHLG